MSKFKVHIEQLDPMRVVVFRGYSKTPEMEAHEHAVAFAKEKGLIDEHNRLKTFGFNKPAPWATKGEQYGYELWVVVDSDVDVPPYLMVKEFPGVKCAVTSIEKLADIGAAWEYLYEWVENSEDYEHAHMDGLEEVLSPLGTPEEELAFNLYLPVS
ncbi:MAG: GyrI-like domain-containing protein [Anaerolineales bacterium]